MATEVKVSNGEFSKAEQKLMIKALNGLMGSLMRSKTKEGDSEIGAIVSKQIHEVRLLTEKLISKELF